MGFDSLYGLELTDCTDSLVRGRVRVRDELTAVTGGVHGGVYSAISEALAVRGTSAEVGPEGLSITMIPCIGNAEHTRGGSDA